MIKYITRRLLLFIPTLFAISLLAFLISINAPGDPVERLVSSSSGDGLSQQTFGEEQQKNYWRNKLGLNLPTFYFSLHALSSPNLEDKITNAAEQNSVERIASTTGNPVATIQFYESKKSLIASFSSTDDSNKALFYPDLNTLKYASTLEETAFRLARLKTAVEKTNLDDQNFRNKLAETENAFTYLKNKSTPWKNYIPVISFHSNNQYHRWVFGDGNWLTGKGSINTKGIIRGDFGISYQTRQPVSEVIGEKIGWSLFFAVLSVILAYIISIPVGIWAGANRNSAFDKGSSLILFVLYSMPGFWVATLLLMIFANPDVLHFFPASGVKPPLGYPANADFITRIQLSLPYIILPLICYTYGSFAFISRTMRVSMLDAMTQDYIRTARAKGLPNSLVIFKHAFRNSLLPLITVFANVFPKAIGGLVIIETIFSIPGMGFEIFQSIQNQNYPMIIAIFTITGILTVSGYLITDILYTRADPRITLWNKR